METAESKIFVGVSGFGKSWMMGWDIEQFFSKGFFPVIVDKKKDHTALGSHLGFKAITVGKTAIDNMDPDKWQNLIKNSKKDGAKGLVIQPKEAEANISQEDLIEMANQIAYAILSIDDKIYFGLEEIRNYAPAQSNDKAFNAVKTVIVEGRSKGIVFGGTCQFPQQVNYKIFDAVPHHIVFGLGTKDNKYQKLSINGETRRKMKNWKVEDRNYLEINQNKGTEEIKSSKDVTRQTPHSG